jgi:hypothetical protein
MLHILVNTVSSALASISVFASPIVNAVSVYSKMAFDYAIIRSKQINELLTAMRLSLYCGTHTTGRTVLVTYQLNGKLYRLWTKKRSGPCDVMAVENSNGRDITDYFFSFAGPNLDFHGSALTPRALGCDGVMIMYTNGECTDFKAGEVIRLSRLTG